MLRDNFSALHRTAELTERDFEETGVAQNCRAEGNFRDQAV
jgi:hypothetical protein